MRKSRFTEEQIVGILQEYGSSGKRLIRLAVTHKFLLVVLPRYERLRQGQRGGRGRAI